MDFEAPCSALESSLPRALQQLPKNSEIKNSWIIKFSFLTSQAPHFSLPSAAYVIAL